MWIQGTIRFYVQERGCKDVGANKFFCIVELNFEKIFRELLKVGMGVCGICVERQNIF